MLGSLGGNRRRRETGFLSLFTKPLVALTVILAIVIVFHPFSRNADGRLRVSMIDVGQGDSTLIELPSGAVMLIDGGGTPEWKRDIADTTFTPDIRGVGEMAVADTLFRRGIDSIEYAAVTHSDGDHAAGLTEILRAMPVRTLLTGRIDTTGEAAELFTTAMSQGMQIEIVESGTAFEIDGVVFEVLHPRAGVDAYDNDNSLVIRVTYGEIAILLTGDIERNAEHLIINGGLALSADVVKIPHHGSRTSSTAGFVDATRASYAVVSAGRRSQFGHPHPDVTQRWINAGANVISTQTSGMITFTADGKTLTIETAVGE